MKLRIAGIAEDSIVDGQGIRLTVFVQGCHHHCPGCHNQHTWDEAGGAEVDVDDIVKRYIRNPLLDGITLSGGEPFNQPEPCLELLSKVYHRCNNIWCYTGYTWEELSSRTDFPSLALLEHIDVLVDGRFHIEERTLELPWRGSKNQRIINVRKSLEEGKVVEYMLKGD